MHHQLSFDCAYLEKNPLFVLRFPTEANLIIWEKRAMVSEQALMNKKHNSFELAGSLL